MKRMFSILTAIGLLAGLLTGCQMSTEQPEESTDVSIPAPDPARMAQPIPEADSFAGGTGTEEDPYLIETAGQLARMIRLIDQSDADHPYHQACYRLEADLALNDCSDWDSWNEATPEFQWNPNTVRSFEGCFDGGGHTVRGMYCYGPAESADGERSAGLGLFGRVSGGTIRNLTIRESYLCCLDVSFAGLLSAEVTDGGAVENCVCGGTVEAERSSGSAGLVGHLEGRMSDCINRAAVSGHGGLVGSLTGTMESCRNEGAVSSTLGAYDVGGLAGTVCADIRADCALSECENTGSVRALKNGSWTGGLIGSASAENGSLRLDSCTNSGQITANEKAGGLIGVIWSGKSDESSAELSNCTNVGAVAAGDTLGGVCSELYTGDGAAVKLERCINRGAFRDLMTRSEGVTEGGLIGTLTMKSPASVLVDQCMNTAQLHTDSGGLGGMAAHVIATGSRRSHASIRFHACENHGNLSASSGGMGGMIGSATLLQWKKGSDISLDECVNTGNLYCHSNGTPCNMGGIAGRFMGGAAPKTTTISDCYSSGSITLDAGNLEISSESGPVAPSNADGIVAQYYDRGIFSGCDFSGTIEVVNGPSVWLNTQRISLDEDGTALEDSRS